MSRFPLTALFLLVFAAPIPLPAQTDPTEGVAHLPEANPYRAVAMRWLSLSANERETISDWTYPKSDDEKPSTPLDAEHEEIARALANELVIAAKTGAIQPELWPPKTDPKNPDNPMHMLIPDVGAMRDLARITVKIADASPAADAIPLYAATARFGRDIRSGATLIQGLAGISIESLASAGPARRLNEFSPKELEALSATWLELPQPAGIEPALHAERNAFFIPLLERAFLPGLLAMQAEGIASFDAVSRSAPSPALNNLRLSGLIEAGDEQLIHLEKIDTGHTFSVTNHRPAEGVRLIRFDSKAGRAWLRVNGTPAVLDLQSKRFVSTRADIERFRRFLGVDAGDETPEWVRRALAHPDGPEGYVIDLIEEYDRRMAEPIADARHNKTPQTSPDDKITDPVLAMVIPTMNQVARTMTAASVQPIMLEAAIRHRLGQFADSPRDPWGELDAKERPAAFAFERTPDGGFLLRSAYERDHEEPYTYKFGAPDAGVQRNPPSSK